MQFEIRNRFISRTDGDNPIADNSDYVCHFDFDSEWEGKTKIARFVTESGEAYDKPILNDTCVADAMPDGIIKVGVYTSEMTTGYVKVYYKASIKTDSQLTPTPAQDVVTQLLNAIDDAVEESVLSFAEEHSEVLKGTDGVSPTATIVSTSSGARVTITDKNGTTTATLLNGRNGEPGEPGEKGEKGDAGRDGTNGTNGTNGKSAYEIAVQNGFSGSQSEWLESLKGTGKLVAYSDSATSDTIIKIVEEEGEEIELAEIDDTTVSSSSTWSSEKISSEVGGLNQTLEQLNAKICVMSPQIVSTLNVGGVGAFDYIFDGTMVYVLTSQALLKYDISDINAPIKKGTISLTDRINPNGSNASQGMVKVGNYIYLGQRNGQAGLPNITVNNGAIRVIDLTTFTLINTVLSLKKVSDVKAHTYSDGSSYLFSAEQMRGYKVYDISTDATNPTVVKDVTWEFSEKGEIQKTFIAEINDTPYWFCSGFGINHALKIYDISNPLEPTEVIDLNLVTEYGNRSHSYQSVLNYPYLYMTFADERNKKGVNTYPMGIIVANITDLTNITTELIEVPSAWRTSTFGGDAMPTKIIKDNYYLYEVAGYGLLLRFHIEKDGGLSFDSLIRSENAKACVTDNSVIAVNNGYLFVSDMGVYDENGASMPSGACPRQVRIHKLY